MGTFLIWVIGKDQYTEALIYYLSKFENVIVSTSNLEYVNDNVRVLSPCDMNELKADAIILPYTQNISLGKVGKLNLDESFYNKQKEALFFFTAISNYTKLYAKKMKLKFYSLFELDEVNKIKKQAIVDLIMHAIVEHSEISLSHLDFGIINDVDLSSYFIDYFTKNNYSYLISDKLDNLLDQNIIIIPDGIEIDKETLNKYKNYNFLLINLYEENISFSVIKNARIKKIYSLRLTKYAFLSYAYAFSKDIYKLLENTNQQN